MAKAKKKVRVGFIGCGGIAQYHFGHFDKMREKADIVAACDLRAGAAMVIAGLAAQGITTVEDIHFIERGYQEFVGKLQLLGGDIHIIEVPDEPQGWTANAG